MGPFPANGDLAAANSASKNYDKGMLLMLAGKIYCKTQNRRAEQIHVNRGGRDDSPAEANHRAPVLAQGTERRARLAGKKFRLFPGCEMATLINFVEIDQMWIGTLGPALRCTVDLTGKNRHSHRH